MDDLVAFLRACLDEEADRAGAGTSGPWRADVDEEVVFAGDEVVARMRDFNRSMTAAQVAADTELVAVHADPERVLREVAAKRRIVDAYLPPGADPHPGLPCINYEGQDPAQYDEFGTCERHWQASKTQLRHDFVLRLLALPYADHPEYRQEWTP